MLAGFRCPSFIPDVATSHVGSLAEAGTQSVLRSGNFVARSATNCASSAIDATTHAVDEAHIGAARLTASVASNIYVGADQKNRPTKIVSPGPRSNTNKKAGHYFTRLKSAVDTVCATNIELRSETEQRQQVLQTTEAIMALPESAPVRNLGADWLRRGIPTNFFTNHTSLVRAYELLTDLGAIPFQSAVARDAHSAASAKAHLSAISSPAKAMARSPRVLSSAPTSSCKPALKRQSTMAMREMLPTMLRDVCSGLLAQEMLHVLDEAVVLPHFCEGALGEETWAQRAVHDWAISKQQSMHQRIEIVARLMPPHVVSVRKSGDIVLEFNTPEILTAMRVFAQQLRALKNTIDVLTSKIRTETGASDASVAMLESASRTAEADALRAEVLIGPFRTGLPGGKLVKMINLTLCGSPEDIGKKLNHPLITYLVSAGSTSHLLTHKTLRPASLRYPIRSDIQFDIQVLFSSHILTPFLHPYPLSSHVRSLHTSHCHPINTSVLQVQLLLSGRTRHDSKPTFIQLLASSPNAERPYAAAELLLFVLYSTSSTAAIEGMVNEIESRFLPAPNVAFIQACLQTELIHHEVQAISVANGDKEGTGGKVQQLLQEDIRQIEGMWAGAKAAMSSGDAFHILMDKYHDMAFIHGIHIEGAHTHTRKQDPKVEAMEREGGATNNLRLPRRGGTLEGEILRLTLEKDRISKTRAELAKGEILLANTQRQRNMVEEK